MATYHIKRLTIRNRFYLGHDKGENGEDGNFWGNRIGAFPFFNQEEALTSKVDVAERDNTSKYLLRIVEVR